MAQTIQDDLVGLLEMVVVEAKNLPSMDLNGKADPFFVVKFMNKTIHKSEIHKKTLTPTFNETAKILISQSERNYSVNLSLWDWDKMSKNEEIGEVEIDIGAHFADPELQKLWLPLQNSKGKAAGLVHVHIRMLNKQQVEESFWLGFTKFFDTNNNNKISSTEFKGLVTSIHTDLTDNEVDELFVKVAGDINAEVDFEPLYRYIVGEPRLSAALLGQDANFLWHVYAESVDLSDIGSHVFTKGFLEQAPDKGKKPKEKIIMVHNRETGRLEEEKIPHYIYTSLRIMYSTASGRFAVEGGQVKKLLNHLSVSQGKKYDTEKSIHDIKPFIKFHELNEAEMLEPLDKFKNFNEFFFRKLKASARPISDRDDPYAATSPADCRMNVFQTIDIAKNLWIKGKHFNLHNLLKSEGIEKEFEGCSLVIARLAPQDYHRFHLPVDCKIVHNTPIDGALFTVNPIAVRENVDVYTENKRIVTILETSAFGRVVFVSIGATMVGSIKLTSEEGKTYKKGDEHGYFAFGGSTVLLLFRQGSITFDSDLLVNSQKPIETLVKMGVHIGVATSAKK